MTRTVLKPDDILSATDIKKVWVPTPEWRSEEHTSELQSH